MVTPGSIIDALGGTTLVADALRVSKSTVSGWRERTGGIPGPYWAALVRLADDRGVSTVTLEALAEMHARDMPAEPEGARA